MHRFLILSLLTAFTLTVAACGDSTETSAPDADDTMNAPARQSVTVANVEMGDIACYLILDNGEMLKADFSICEQDLNGKTIEYETTSVNIQSPECEGDPECTKSVTEDLVTSVTVIR
ncbi:MAG: hypothetical protein KDK27_13620 [Leptospiraceae bacterium]|nr:hypothetical protein [Leptospiraceae bacterium]